MARAVKLNGSFVQICTGSDGVGGRLAADEEKMLGGPDVPEEKVKFNLDRR